MPPLSPEDHPFLYRATRNKRWLKVWSAAFRLRGPSETRPQPETSLSFIVFDNCTKSICAAEQRDCYGELVLGTQAVLGTADALGWEVDKDAHNHASILGLPLYDADRQLIEDAAQALADLINAVQPRSDRPE